MPPLSSITFLSPLPAIIAASIALPILLLLYFLKLRRRPARVSSTLLWESAARDLQVNTPFRIIRPSWILLLQLLALLCFLAALARPAVEAGDTGSSELVVITIDTSASMSAPAGMASKLSRLEDAKVQAARIVRTLPTSTQLMLITVAAEPTTRVAFTSNRAEIIRSIQTITPTDQPADLSAAIQLLRAFTANTAEADAPAPPRVIFISDGNPTAAANHDSANHDIAAALTSIALQFIRVGPGPSEERDNLAVTAISARRDDSDPSLIRVYARLQSTLRAPIEPALLCRVNGRLVPSPPTTIPAAADQAGAVATAPLSFTVTSPDPLGDRVTMSLTIPRRDDLPADNTASIVIEPPSSLRVLFVHPNSRIDARLSRPEDALAAFEPETLESITLAEYERRLISPASLSRFSLVVFDAVRPSALPLVPTISFASPVPLPAVGLTPYDPDDPARAPTPFVFWKRTHPLLRYAALDSAIIFNHRRLSLPAESAPPDAPGATVIATGRSGPLIALLDDKSTPRIVAAFPLAGEPWLREPAFHIFLANAIDFLTHSTSDASIALTTTSPITVRPAPGASTIEITGPITSSRAVDDPPVPITLPPFPRVGVYNITNTLPRAITAPINLLDPDESAIGTSDTLLIASTPTRSSPIADTARREIWHYFVSAALVLLTIEWLVVARRMRL